MPIIRDHVPPFWCWNIVRGIVRVFADAILIIKIIVEVLVIPSCEVKILIIEVMSVNLFISLCSTGFII